MMTKFRTGQYGFNTRTQPGNPLRDRIVPMEEILRRTYGRMFNTAELPTAAGRRRPPGS